MEKIKNINEVKNYISDNYFHNVLDRNNDTISVLDYIHLLNDYFSPMFDINKNNAPYVWVLNKNLKKGINNDIYSFSKEEIKHMNRFTFDKIEFNLTQYNPNICSLDIRMHRTIPLKHSHNYLISLRRDNDNLVYDNIQPYYSSNKEYIKKCIDYSHEYLIDLIKFLESYEEILNNTNETLKIHDKLFTANILIKDNKFVSSSLILNDIVDMENLGKDSIKELSEYINDGADLILSSIPIKINQLPNELQDYLHQQREKEELDRLERQLNTTYGYGTQKKLTRSKK